MPTDQSDLMSQMTLDYDKLKVKLTWASCKQASGSKFGSPEPNVYQVGIYAACYNHSLGQVETGDSPRAS